MHVTPAGCSPQSCSYRDHYAELQSLGVSSVYGVSTQDTEYQAEAQQRLHLPFPLLSDSQHQLTRALRLPTFQVGRYTFEAHTIKPWTIWKNPASDSHRASEAQYAASSIQDTTCHAKAQQRLHLPSPLLSDPAYS